MTVATASVAENPTLPADKSHRNVSFQQQGQATQYSSNYPITPGQNVNIEEAGRQRLFWSPSGIEPNVDPRFALPRCELPPRKEFEPVETFVAAAVREQHGQKDDTIPLKNYKGILEALRYKNDLPLLKKILLAMRTSRDTMNLLTSGASSKHARLIHQILRFDPFYVQPVQRNDAKEEGDGQICDDKIDYGLADAHLCLIVALVSANSVYLVPALTALWKLLISDKMCDEDR